MRVLSWHHLTLPSADVGLYRTLKFSSSDSLRMMARQLLAIHVAQCGFFCRAARGGIGAAFVKSAT